MTDLLLQNIEQSNSVQAAESFRREIARGGLPWAIHLSLFPVAQRVLNPPFINPHLPKMHGIYRELAAYLSEAEIPALIRLEINEFARRPKREEIPRPAVSNSAAAFPEIEEAVRAGDRDRAGALMNAFREQQGEAELARKLLLLGSGYLDQTLGHSVSCTAFVLLEMMERSDQDPWPALATLADYFCKGQFHETPRLRTTPTSSSREFLGENLMRAASGEGIVNLHHTITLYSMERVRALFAEPEYSHLVACWVEFLGGKKAKAPEAGLTPRADSDYQDFYSYFARREEKSVLNCLGGMISSGEGRRLLGKYLVKGVADLYQGNYDPHFLTGLGSALWVINEYWNEPSIPVNALRQYVNYFFAGLAS
jgi:hypothetical protein